MTVVVSHSTPADGSFSAAGAAAWDANHVVTGAAASGANNDITSLTGLTTALSVGQGGTGATTLTGVLKGNGTSAFTAASAGTDYVAPGVFTTSGLTMATARLLGRTTAGTGASEEISVGAGLTLSGGTLVNAGATSPIGGSDTQVQFNDGGVFAGNSNFTFNKTTNQIAIAAGSAAAPTLIPTGDLNTGMWFPAADTVAWSTGGSERMRILSSGNVGIGTSSPGHLLQVNATGSTISATTSSTTTQFTGPGLRLYNTNASMGTQAGLGVASLILDASATQGYMTFFQTNNSGGFVRDILRYNYNASLWQFYTNATEKLRIDTNGNLGLGTTTFGTSAAVTLAIATGTAPTTGPADTIQIYSTDLSAGNTMLSLYTEGTVVNANVLAATTHRIAIRVNGTVYYLLANTSA